MTIERNALLAAGLTSLMWGFTGILVRLLRALSPLTVTAGWLLVALVVTLPILWLFRSSHQSLKSALGRPVAYVLALLLAGYYLLATAAFISGMEGVSHLMGVSALLLSLLIIPIATELPEKVNSILWVRRDKDTLAFGNITGAMVFQGTLLPAIGIMLPPGNPVSRF